MSDLPMDSVSEQSGRQVDDAVTVVQLQAWLDEARRELAAAAGEVGQLQAWCRELPRRHVVEDGSEPPDVLVTDLVQTTVEDPMVLQRRVQQVRDLAAQIVTMVGSVHTTVRTDTGPFAATAGLGTAQGPVDTVTVVASCGSQDEETFDRQRLAVRRALTFEPATTTWRGQLPARISTSPQTWAALAEAAEAGAHVRVLP